MFLSLEKPSPVLWAWGAVWWWTEVRETLQQESGPACDTLSFAHRAAPRSPRPRHCYTHPCLPPPRLWSRPSDFLPADLVYSFLFHFFTICLALGQLQGSFIKIKTCKCKAPLLRLLLPSVAGHHSFRLLQADHTPVCSMAMLLFTALPCSEIPPRLWKYY